MDFHHRHAIITGGSSGIGRATACLLAQRGADVSIIARGQEMLDETVTELETLRRDETQHFRAWAADVGEWEQAQEAVEGLCADGYPPEFLINAAGYCHPGYFEDLSVDVFRDSMAVDFFGTLYPTKAAMPMMVKQGRGHIVNFASVAGFYAFFGFTAYSAAKFAVTGFSEALRQEMMPHNILVSVIFPPTTETPGLERENRLKPLETQRIEGQVKARSAGYVARALVQGIEQHKRHILPGLDTKMYFLLAHLPPALTGVFRWYFIDRVITRARRERYAQKL